MLQLLGSGMIILGFLLVGFQFVEKEIKIIHVIEKWEQIMYMYISEITYKKQPLALAGYEIGEKVRGREGDFLKRVSERLQEKRTESFYEIWNEEAVKYCKEERISVETQRLILEFGLLTGYEDENVQRQMIEEQKEKWKNIRLKKQEEHQERKRLILILSSCMGIMLVLILW